MTRPGPIHLLAYLLILTGLGLAYLPALEVIYCHHDELMFLEQTHTRWDAHPLFDFFIFAGRSFAAAYMTLADWMVADIGDLNLLRLMTMLILAVTACFFYRWLARHFFSAAQAALFSIAVFTLPAFEITAAWAGISYLAPAVLLAVLAGVLTHQTPDSPRVRGHILLSAGLLFMSLNFYPSASTFFWVFPAIVLLLSDNTSRKGPLLRFFSVGLMTHAAYALLLWTTKKFVPPIDTTFYNPYLLPADPVKKLLWFVKEPLLNAANLWKIYPDRATAMALAVFILSGFLPGLFSKGRISWATVRANLRTGALLIILLLLSYLPNLCASSDAPFYRCSAGLTSLVLACVLGSALRWVKLLPRQTAALLTTALLLGTSIYGTHRSFHNILLGRAIPSVIEMDHLWLSVQRQAALTKLEYVHFLRPPPLSPQYRYDEFGILSTAFRSDIIALNTLFVRRLTTLAGMDYAIAGMDYYSAVLDRDKRTVYYMVIIPSENPYFFSMKIVVTSSETGQPLRARPGTIVLETSSLDPYLRRLVEELK